MSKNIKILIISICVILVIAVVATVMFVNSNKNKNQEAEKNNNVTSQNQATQAIELNTTDDLENAITKVYENTTVELPRLNTTVIDINDSNALKYNTGLDSNEGIEAVVVSEPLMSSQAYSLVLVKLTDGANKENIKQNMFDNIDTRKWVCVEADKLFVTDSQNVVCLLMANEDWAQPVYDALKTVLGTTGSELTK